MLHVVNCLVIEAQIPMQEDLQSKTSIQFPSVTNMSDDVTMVFGNMTPMIEIPSSIILRQLEEGTYNYICISVCMCIIAYVFHYYLNYLLFDFLVVHYKSVHVKI